MLLTNILKKTTVIFTRRHRHATKKKKKYCLLARPVEKEKNVKEIINLKECNHFYAF